MALHCAATLVLVSAGVPVDQVEGPGAFLADAVAAEVDVIDGLQALADLHRGERVVVPVEPEQLASVLEHLGRARRPGEHAGAPVRLEIGDDGWALSPVGS